MRVSLAVPGSAALLKQKVKDKSVFIGMFNGTELDLLNFSENSCQHSKPCRKFWFFSGSFSSLGLGLLGHLTSLRGIWHLC